mmetsp:Transcript_16573/g.38719  ORF Transcript_16573/g.38719 Transcript_16573/m.38719 type:complete len:285 (-) Transcript_16573:715-1569(-)
MKGQVRPPAGHGRAARPSSAPPAMDLGLVALLKLLLELHLPLVEAHLGLEAHHRGARLEPGHLRAVEVVHAVLLKVAELALVSLVDRGEAERGRVLLVHEGTEARLVLDDAVRHVHLAAEGRQPYDKLDRVNVRRDDDKLRLLLLHKRGHVLEAELDGARRALGLNVLAGGGGLGSGKKAGLLIGRRLRAVLGEQLEEGGGLVLRHRVRELVDRRRHRKTIHEDLLLALEAHVARPLDEAAKVAAGRLRMGRSTGGRRVRRGRHPLASRQANPFCVIARGVPRK